MMRSACPPRRYSAPILWIPLLSMGYALVAVWQRLRPAQA
jgi:hypothetical protein